MNLLSPQPVSAPRGLSHWAQSFQRSLSALHTDSTIGLEGTPPKDGFFPGFWEYEPFLCLFSTLTVISNFPLATILKKIFRGAWVAQLVKRLISAQVMILKLLGSSPPSGSALTAQSLQPASDSVSHSLSAPPPLVLSLKNK